MGFENVPNRGTKYALSSQDPGLLRKCPDCPDCGEVHGIVLMECPWCLGMYHFLVAYSLPGPPLLCVSCETGDD